MPTFLELATTLYPTLLQTFNTAVNAFNAQDWATLEPLLHENVVLHRIHDAPGSYTYVGKDAVKQYLETQVALDKPQFTPVPPIDVNGLSGVIRGSATWLDHDNGVPTNFRISYQFIFAHDNAHGWRILSMYGSPD